MRAYIIGLDQSNDRAHPIWVSVVLWVLAWWVGCCSLEPTFPPHPANHQSHAQEHVEPQPVQGDTTAAPKVGLGPKLL